MPRYLEADFEVYEKHLSKLKLGHPLWYPEPAESGEIMMGDVGIIKAGAFHRLFNIVHGSANYVNREDIPDDFDSPRRLFHTAERAVSPGHFLSEAMQRMDNIGASRTSSLERDPIYFHCKQNQGAILVLDRPARKKEVFVGFQLAEYMRSHWKSWVHFAQSRHFPDSIFLVSGFVKTASSWSMAAITAHGKDSTLMFDQHGHVVAEEVAF